MIVAFNTSFSNDSMREVHILPRVGFVAFDSLLSERATNTRIANPAFATSWVRFTWRISEGAATAAHD